MTERVKGQNRKQLWPRGQMMSLTPPACCEAEQFSQSDQTEGDDPYVPCLLLATLESFRERRVKFMNKWALLTELYSPLSFTVISNFGDCIIGIVRQWTTAKKWHFAIFLPEITFCCLITQEGGASCTDCQTAPGIWTSPGFFSSEKILDSHIFRVTFSGSIHFLYTKLPTM